MSGDLRGLLPARGHLGSAQASSSWVFPGLALDLTVKDEQGNPWDFHDPEKRRKAEKIIDAEKPMLLIGTPMCAAFSSIQERNGEATHPLGAVLSPMQEPG